MSVHPKSITPPGLTAVTQSVADSERRSPDVRPAGLIDSVGGRASLVVCLVLATVLGAGLRLWKLRDASLWVDELNTVRICADLSNMHRSKLLGYVPTYAGMWASGAETAALSASSPERWRSLGVNEYSTRIGPAICGIACIPILGWLSARVLGVGPAAVLALLLAVSPWHIYWSQAARFYTLQFLCYNIGFLVYWRATGGGGSWRLLVAHAFIVLSFLSQPPALIIACVLAGDWILQFVHKEPVRLGRSGWVATVLALAVCAVIMGSDVRRVPEDWTQFGGQLYQTPGKMILGTSYMVVVPVAVFAILSGMWLWTVERRLGGFLLLGAVVPPLAFGVLSIWVYVGLRYAFVSLYCWLALAAVGSCAAWRVLRPRCGVALASSPLLVLLAAMAMMNYGYYTSGYGFHTRWRDAFEYVVEHRREGDAVCTQHPMIGKYYLETADVLNRPASVEELVAIRRPVWLVVEVEDAIGGRRTPAWFERVLDYRAHFDIRVLQPLSSVGVYYYDPSSRAGAVRQDASSIRAG
jgi:hypothetical protein